MTSIKYIILLIITLASIAQAQTYKPNTSHKSCWEEHYEFEGDPSLIDTLVFETEILGENLASFADLDSNAFLDRILKIESERCGIRNQWTRHNYPLCWFLMDYTWRVTYKYNYPQVFQKRKQGHKGYPKKDYHIRVWYTPHYPSSEMLNIYINGDSAIVDYYLLSFEKEWQWQKQSVIKNWNAYSDVISLEKLLTLTSDYEHVCTVYIRGADGFDVEVKSEDKYNLITYNNPRLTIGATEDTIYFIQFLKALEKATSWKPKAIWSEESMRGMR